MWRRCVDTRERGWLSSQQEGRVVRGFGVIEAGGPRRMRPLLLALALPLVPVVVLAGASLARAQHGTPRRAVVVAPRPMPAARLNAAMAYDPVHRDVVLFGGRTPSGTEFGDTWTWDGAAWHRRDTSHSAAPSPRDAAAMAWDPQLRRVVLFGGSLGTVGSVQDTWTWDGSRWQQQDWWGDQAAVDQPTLVWDATHRQLLLVARLHEASYTATWMLRGGMWARQPVSGPEWQMGTPVVAGWDAGQRRVAAVVSGPGMIMGCAYTADVALVGNRATPGPIILTPPLAPLTPPSGCGPPGGPPCSSGAVGVTSERIQGVSPLAPTPALPPCPPPANAWWWDGTAWRATDQESIPGSDSPVVVPDPLGQRLLVMAGQALWTPEGDHWTVAVAHVPLNDRTGTAFAVDTAHHALVAFGGYLPADDAVAGDTWTWNGHTWTQHPAF